MDEKEADKRLMDAVNLLSEHFDHVQILVSWNEEAETKDMASGSGNWYARLGLCRELILRHDCQELVEQQYQRNKEEDDDVP